MGCPVSSSKSANVFLFVCDEAKNEANTLIISSSFLILIINKCQHKQVVYRQLLMQNKIKLKMCLGHVAGLIWGMEFFLNNALP